MRLGWNPVEIVVFAGVVNGILLPLVAIFQLYAMTQNDSLGEYAHGPIADAPGALVTLMLVWLGVRTLLGLAGVL